MTAEEAVNWVNRNRGLIIVETKKYQLFSPYEREDFIQDAYEAAIMAACVAAKRKLPFEGCFWHTFKSIVHNIVPGVGLDARSYSPPSTLCDDVEPLLDILPCPEGEAEQRLDVDRLYLAVSTHLTNVEKQVWSRALGISDKGAMNQHEIARDLGCSVANVRQAVKRVLTRLSRRAKKGTLNLTPQEIQARRLCLVYGLPGSIPVQANGGNLLVETSAVSSFSIIKRGG